MLIRFLIESVFNIMQSFLHVLLVNQFTMVQLPSTVIDTAFDFIYVALWFLPTGVFPIFVITPAIWLFRIGAAAISGIADLTSKTPIIGWLS